MKFNFQKYFDISTIHGFCYISRKYHLAERIFWVISLLCSAVCTLVLITKFLIKLRNFPTVVYLSDTAVPLSEVNFPAVTICPDFLPILAYDFYERNRQYLRYERHSTKKIYYDSLEYSNTTVDEKKIGQRYTKILDGIENGEIDYQQLGLKMLKRLQVVDMITNRGIFSKLNFFVPNDDFLNIINEFKKEFFESDFILNIKWIEDYKQYVSEILTSEGLCFTFNIAHAEDLLNMNSTSNDFHYQLFLLKFSSISKGLVPPKSLPRKISSSFTGLKMKFNIITMFMDEIFEKNPHGLVFFIHDPFELPSMNSKIFNIDVSQRTQITVDAELNTIDNSIIDYKPADKTTLEFNFSRNCYLDSEKRLKFFKKYTKANCLQECLTDFMINSCSCAEFFMIRNSTTRICSASDEKCCTKARDAFRALHNDCDCLRPCNYTKYNLEINHMDLQKYLYSSDEKTLEISMSFKQDSINHFIHKQQYDVIDFLSYAGGLLGLFAGFSFLSFIELIYWFTIRAAIKNFHRSTRVRPFNENFEDGQRNFSTFKIITKSFLKSSSIHGLRYISKKNLFDKIFWSVLITGFAFIGTVTISKTREKIPDSLIISYDDNLKFKGNINFPAVTIIPEVILRLDYGNTYELFRNIEVKEDVKMKMNNETFKSEAMRVFSQLCTCFDNCVSVEYFGDEMFYDFTSDAKLLMQNEPQTVWFQDQFSTFNENIKPVFAEIRTQFAMGYTFNILDADKLLNFESINSEFRYFQNITTKQPENLFQNASNIVVRRGSEAVLNTRFKILKIDPIDGVCKEIGILIHDIDAFPTFFKRDDVINIGPGKLDIEVIPEIIKSDEDMKNINLSVRKCYFDGEKSLKFFNKYSQKNCIIECLTNYTLNICNCSDPSQPFVKENFCRRNFLEPNEYCPLKSVLKFHSEEGEENSCGCIPTCDSVNYHFKYYYKFASDSDEVEITVRLNSEDAVLFRRYQQFTFSDVLSYVGGLLGLLAGISMLSIVEFFYFFIIRVLVDIYRSFKGNSN